MSGGHHDGRRRRLMALFLAWAAALSMAGSPVGAQAVDPLSTDISNCPAPAATPACAVLAYSQCLWLNKPSLCAAVGAGDLIIWEGPLDTKSDLAAVPREYIGRLGIQFPTINGIVEGPNVVGRLDANGVPLLGSDEYSSGSHGILAVRRVDHDRFLFDDDLEKLIPARFHGSHEVLLGPDFVQSIFFRLEGARWVITSFASVGMDCQGEGDADDFFAYLWRCHRSPPIRGWSDYYPGLWTKFLEAPRK